MQTKAFVWAGVGVVAIALVFVIYTIFIPTPLACGGSPHCIVISVSGGVIGPVSTIKVNAAAVIDWELDAATVAAGYTFVPNVPPSSPPYGINFYYVPYTKNASTKAPDGEFTACAPKVNNTKFQCHDAAAHKSTDPLGYGYLITLQGPGGAVVIKDPYIVNN